MSRRQEFSEPASVFHALLEDGDGQRGSPVIRRLIVLCRWEDLVSELKESSQPIYNDVVQELEWLPAWLSPPDADDEYDISFTAS